MQAGLVKLAANLPKGAMTPNAEATVVNHVNDIVGSETEPPLFTTVRDAAAYVKEQLGHFFATI